MACLGMFVAYLPVTTVSVSLPAIQSVLHASTSQLTWVSSAFQLPMAALILTAGVFGDVHGRKKVYLAGQLVDKAGNVIGTATTGPDGSYAFADLDTGDYSLIASGYPAVAAPVVVDGPVLEFDVALAHSES
ncbi:MFS transporter [Streptomyces sp. NPDC002888]|uniref:MFS transporter n=1 Tax=Streptomyces sp. NPDC002888 TaxID=3364668 RepID=UPI0036D1B8FF